MSGVQPAGTGPQPTEAGSAATRPARRRRRWALRALGVAVAGALLLSAALVLLLTLGLQHGLNSDWARQQLRAQVNERTGAELDYRTLQLNLASGLLVEDLVVLQPSVFRAHAPELLRLSRLELGYRPLLLPLGRLTVETLRARGLQLTLVQDASGRTSLDRLADDKPQQPEPPEPPPPPEAPAVAAPVTPLTRALELADLPLTVQLGELSVTELAVNALALDAGGAVSRRIELRGVQVQGHATLRPGHPEAALRVVSPPDGLQLKITEPGPSGPSQRSLRLALSQGLQVVDAHQVRGSLRIELHEQSFEPRFRYLGPLVGLQLAAKLDPEAGDITATLSDVELLAGAAHVSATATVHEELDGPVRRLSAIVGSTGSVDLQRAHATAEPLVGPTGIKELRGTFQWALSDLRLDLDTFAPYGGQLALDTQVQRLLGDVGGASLDGEELGLKVEFAPLDEDSYRLEVGAPVGRLHASVAGQRLRLRQAELRLEIPAAHPSWLSPASSWGELVLKLRAGGLFVASGPDRVQASTVGLRLKVMRQRRGGPLRLDLNGGVRELDVHRGDTLLVPIRKGTVKLTGRNLRPDLGQPLNSLGNLSLQAELGPLVADARLARSEVAEASFEVDVTASSLQLVGTLLPPDLKRQIGRVPYRRMSALLRSKGTLDPRGLTDPSRLRLQQTARIELRNLRLQRRDLRLVTRLLSVDLSTKSQGRARQQAELKLVVRSPLYQGRRFAGSLGLSGTLGLDLNVPNVALQLDNLPGAEHRVHVDLAARLSGRAHTLDYQLDLELQRLGPLLRLAGPPEGLPLDLARLDVLLRSKGTIDGLVRRVVRGVPTLHADPLPRLRGRQQTAVSLGGLLVEQGDLRAEIPRLDLNVSSTGGLNDLELKGDLDVSEATVDQGTLHLHARDLRPSVELRTAGGLGEGTVSLKLTAALGTLNQDVAPEVAVGDLSLRARAELQALDTLRIPSVSVRNKDGGQHVKLQGVVTGLRGLLTGSGRPSLALKGRVIQDLARLRLERHRLTASGKVELPFELESEALDRLRLSSTLAAQAVSLSAPKQGLRVERFDGRVRVEQVIALPPGGPPRLVPVATRNPYSRATFADVHPYLGDDSYFSLQRISLKGRTLGPIAGNLSVQRNIIGLHQIQFAVGGGKVFGACIVDYEPGNTLLLFRGKLTDIEPSTGGSDRFDGNAALRFNVDHLDLEGRVHIVRISSAHLADMLDLVDPYHEDPNLNRVRLGLKVGHPRYVRVKMKDGLLALKVELGGAASVVNIEEIRGVALGPFLNRYVAPLLPPGGTRFGAAVQPAAQATPDASAEPAAPSSPEPPADPAAVPAGASPTEPSVPAPVAPSTQPSPSQEETSP